MTGREKIEAAFSARGATELPVVLPYETLLVRDHWHQFCDEPWWQEFSPNLETQLRWRRACLQQIPMDWFKLPLFYSRAERAALAIETRPDGVYLANAGTGQAQRLRSPDERATDAARHLEPLAGRPAGTAEEISRLVPLPPDFDGDSFAGSGAGDLAAGLLQEFGSARFPVFPLSSPFWSSAGLWGFETFMTVVLERPDLVRQAGERYLRRAEHAVDQAAALGARGIWIEECLTNLVPPAVYADLNLPLLQQLIRRIRARGLVSIYYYTGNPQDRWPHLLAAGADALAFEESKKDFRLDVAELAERLDGRCALLGNVDAIGILQDASEPVLAAELERQLRAGRRNGNRFILSLGSPVTPGTSLERIRRYLDLGRKRQPTPAG